MDRERFVALLDAYGAEFRRWPDDERATGVAYAQRNAEAEAWMAEARRLDDELDAVREASPIGAVLTGRVLAQAPRAPRAVFDRRALFALAACAVFGVVLGYGGAMFAPMPMSDDSYFSMAFEPPSFVEDEG